MEDKAFLDRMEELGRGFGRKAAEHDQADAFVAGNYAALREAKVLSALVPKDLGGGGVPHGIMCEGLRILARHCGSTALSLSMHMHLTAFQVFNHLQGKPVRALLEKVARDQIVLVSTGANDWLASNGRAEKAEGGFIVTARKSFASGSPAGDLLLTSAPYLDPAEGWQVLHFPVPFNSPGVKILEDWKTLGMRGTGSNSVSLEQVFVPEAAVGMRRPRGTFHPVFAVITVLACPLIASVYLGLAEAAAALGKEQARKRAPDAGTPFLLGEMENQLALAQMAVESMVANANGYAFAPNAETANRTLVRKTLAVNAALATAEKALEASGGGGFFRQSGLERILRDLHAGQFHPLSEKRQHLFTGRLALGLEPVEPAVYAQE
jgi:alkylation response protein AidB-like acyl-CoA dehydrogenase